MCRERIKYRYGFGGRAHCVFPFPSFLNHRMSIAYYMYVCAAVLHVFHFRRNVQTSEIFQWADRPSACKCDVLGRRTAAGLRSDRALARAKVAKVQSREARRAETTARESIRPIRLRRIFTFLRRPPAVIAAYINYRTHYSLYHNNIIMLIVLRILILICIIINIYSFTAY